MDEIKGMSAQIWLNFFNTYLYEQGLITEVERNKMISKIANTQVSSIKADTISDKIKKISNVV
ncbi:unknown [Clostridium sp. CAG:557]|nr:unknown [Clostridium sp. CAG:557]